MHRHNGGHRRAILSVIRLSGLPVQIAFSFEIFSQLRGVHRIRLLVNIDKVGARPGLADRLRRRDEGVRDRHDDVARLHSCGHQSKSHGVGAVGYANAILRVAKRGEFAFEILDHGAADKSGGLQDFLKNGSELRLQLLGAA